MATTESVLALDTQTGEEVWRGETPVASWRADHEKLAISDGVVLTILGFGGGSDEAEPGQDEGGPGREDAASAVLVGDPPSAVSAENENAATVDMFANASLAVPEDCAAQLQLPGSTMSFANGRSQTESGEVSMSFVTPVLVGGELDYAVALRCRVVGQENAAPTVGIYEQTLGLVTSLDLAEGLLVSALPSDLKVEVMVGEGSVVGPLLHSDAQDICQGCSEPSVAQVGMLWDDEQFVALDVQSPTATWATDDRPSPITSGPALLPGDLADITLDVPQASGLGNQELVQLPFQDYTSVQREPGLARTYDIGRDEIQQMHVDGQPYLIFPLYNLRDTEVVSGLVGTVCAVSVQKDVVCAPPRGGDRMVVRLQPFRRGRDRYMRSFYRGPNCVYDCESTLRWAGFHSVLVALEQGRDSLAIGTLGA